MSAFPPFAEAKRTSGNALDCRSAHLVERSGSAWRAIKPLEDALALADELQDGMDRPATWSSARSTKHEPHSSGHRARA